MILISILLTTEHNQLNFHKYRLVKTNMRETTFGDAMQKCDWHLTVFWVKSRKSIFNILCSRCVQNRKGHPKFGDTCVRKVFIINEEVI